MGLGPGLTETAVEGSHVPGSFWQAVVAVCWGWMVGCLQMGMWTRVLMGSWCVAASVVTVRVGVGGLLMCWASGPGLWAFLSLLLLPLL